MEQGLVIGLVHVLVEALEIAELSDLFLDASLDLRRDMVDREDGEAGDRREAARGGGTL